MAKPGTCHNRRRIPRRVPEDLILDALKERLMAPELVTEFIAEYHAEINRQLHAAELDAGFDRRELEETHGESLARIMPVALVARYC